MFIPGEVRGHNQANKFEVINDLRKAAVIKIQLEHEVICLRVDERDVFFFFCDADLRCFHFLPWSNWICHGNLKGRLFSPYGLVLTVISSPERLSHQYKIFFCKFALLWQINNLIHSCPLAGSWRTSNWLVGRWVTSCNLVGSLETPIWLSRRMVILAESWAAAIWLAGRRKASSPWIGSLWLSRGI